MRVNNAPAVDVHSIQGDYPPAGLVGPPPPPAPDIRNAIYAAAGHRVRTLPLSRDGFRVTAPAPRIPTGAGTWLPL